MGALSSHGLRAWGKTKLVMVLCLAVTEFLNFALEVNHHGREARRVVWRRRRLRGFWLALREICLLIGKCFLADNLDDSSKLFGGELASLAGVCELLVLSKLSDKLTCRLSL